MILLLKNDDGWDILTNAWTMAYLEPSKRCSIHVQGTGDDISVRLDIDAFQKHLRDSSTICDLRGYCE